MKSRGWRGKLPALAALALAGCWCGPAVGGVPLEGDVIQPQPLLALGMGEARAAAAEVISGLTESKGPRNPFAPSARLLTLKDQPSAAASLVAESEFTPVKQAEKMPKMRLRGHLQGRDGEVLALLELVGGDVYIVREGDTVGLHDFGIDSVIRVQKISRLHLVVESGSLNQKIIVR
jgi:hypothetical protein